MENPAIAEKIQLIDLSAIAGFYCIMFFDITYQLSINNCLDFKQVHIVIWYVIYYDLGLKCELEC